MAVGGIDPELVVVLTAGRALERSERDTTISGAVHRGAHGVDNVRILRVHKNAATIVALPVADAGIFSGHVTPGGAAIVRAVESRAVFDVGADDVHALTLGVHGDGERNAAFIGRDLNLGPRLAFIGGFEGQRRLAPGSWAPITGSATGTALATCALRGSQHHAGFVERVLQIARSVIAVWLQDVGRAVHTTAVVSGVAKGRDDHQLGICGVDDDAVDLHGVLEPDVLPALTGVARFPHAVSEAAADGIA